MNDLSAVVLLVNYFAAGEVGAAVESVVRHGGDAQLTISVVDNSCDEHEWSRLNRRVAEIDAGAGSIVLTRSDANLGYAGGNNAAYAAVRDALHDAVFVINPDCVIAVGDLGRAIAQARETPLQLFAAPTRSAGRSLSGIASVSLASGRSRELSMDELRRAPRLSFRFPSGHFIAAATATWQALGGFSEQYFLYSEEPDLVFRNQARGGTIGIFSDIEVAHAGGSATGSAHGGLKSDVTLFHATRSRVLLFRSHAAIRKWLPAVVLARIAFAAGESVKSGPRAGATVLRGVWSGLTTSDWQPR